MDRRNEILKAIVQHFIETAEPVGSKTVVLSYHFSVSPATVRNDMMWLEHEGLIQQPHTSAGRVPTDLGYRQYVNTFVDDKKTIQEAEKTFDRVLKQYQWQKAREKIYDAVSILAQATDNISFATLPNNKHTFFLGISNVLKQPEFRNDPMRASQVVEVLEDNDQFVTTLNGLPIEEDEASIFIGKENILKQIQSCSMVVERYRFGDIKGFIGVLGSTRMRYPFNRVIVEKVTEMLGG